MRLLRGRTVRGSVILAGAVLAMSLGAAPTNAAAGDSPKDTQACWFNYDTKVTRCFVDKAAFEAALAAEGRVLLRAGDPAPAARGGVTPLALYSLVTLYADTNKTGAYLTSTTTISTTCSTHHFTFNSMPGGWDNRVSSFLSYGPCKTRLSEFTNQGGSSFGPVASANSVGVMNDATSSYWVTG